MFNVKTTKKKTLNKADGSAYSLDTEYELVMRTASLLFGESKYYKNEQSEYDAVLQKAIKDNPEFVLKLAAYTRNELFIRSTPLYMLVECANLRTGSVDSAYKYVSRIVRRADELSEVVALQFSRNKINNINKHVMPKMLKKGLSKAFTGFNEYQFAKYNRVKEVKLRDVMFLVHPKPVTPSQANVFAMIASDSLPVPETWETVMSNWSKKFDTKKEAWEYVMPKMGILAQLRNLRNFVAENCDIKAVLDTFTDENIKKSMIFPFRFYIARKILEDLPVYASPKIQVLVEMLDNAMKVSTKYVGKLPGNTLILVDGSGSMSSSLSKDSTVQCSDIANFFGGVSPLMCEYSDVIVFAEKFKKIFVSKDVMTNVGNISNAHVGYATYPHLPLNKVREDKAFYDRIIMFSDMQCYSQGIGNEFASSLTTYKRDINPNCKLYSIDLVGYGTAQVLPSKDVALIGGWSDKILKFISVFERDRSTMLDEIKNYKV